MRSDKTSSHFPQLPHRNLLHLVNRDGAVHVHRCLVGLVAKKVLYPFSSEMAVPWLDTNTAPCLLPPIRCARSLICSSSIMGTMRVFPPVGTTRTSRPKALTPKKAQMLQDLYRNKENSIDEICKTLNISRTTLYRYIKT